MASHAFAGLPVTFQLCIYILRMGIFNIKIILFLLFSPCSMDIIRKCYLKTYMNSRMIDSSWKSIKITSQLMKQSRCMTQDPPQAKAFEFSFFLYSFEELEVSCFDLTWRENETATVSVICFIKFRLYLCLFAFLLVLGSVSICALFHKVWSLFACICFPLPLDYVCSVLCLIESGLYGSELLPEL